MIDPDAEAEEIHVRIEELELMQDALQQASETLGLFLKPSPALSTNRN